MRRSIVGVLLLAVCLALGSHAARADVMIKQAAYQGWKEAYWLTNGTVEVVVVPAVARIMRYGFVGEPNALWDNPTVAGKPAEIGQWPNIGGDKIWPWPQNEWPRRTGRAWPPPAASDQTAHQVETVGKDTLRLTSPVLAGYGVRIVRDIRLAPTGTQVTLRSRFEKVRTGAQFPVAVWSITQLPVPDVAVARLLPGSTLAEGYKLFIPQPWKSLRGEGRFLFAERPTSASAKFGTDADLLAWVKGDLLYTQKTVSTPPITAITPGDRAQIYSHPDNADDLARGITPYIELELTSPQKTLASGETLTLDVVWELRRLSGPQRRPDGLTALLATL